MAKNKLLKYFVTGLKVWVVMLLGTFIMIVPSLMLTLLILGSSVWWMLLYFVTIPVGLTLNGFLLTKFKSWIF